MFVSGDDYLPLASVTGGSEIIGRRNDDLIFPLAISSSSSSSSFPLLLPLLLRLTLGTDSDLMGIFDLGLAAGPTTANRPCRRR